MIDILTTDIQFLQGVGPKKGELLKKQLGIATYRDFVYTFPFRYIDRTRFHTIREISSDIAYLQMKGKIVGSKIEGSTPRQKRLILSFTDGTGMMDLVFFQGIKWIQEKIVFGKEYVVFGKPSTFNQTINMVHPEIDAVETDTQGNYSASTHGIYSSTEVLRNHFIGNKQLVKWMQTLLKMSYTLIQETLPRYLCEQYQLLPLPQSLLNIHFPQSPELLEKAIYRIKFEELFYIQLSILKIRSNRIEKSVGITFGKVGVHFNQFYSEKLPFQLTDAQKRVVREIRQDMGSGKQMNRLLQGDVGSGKTLVALLCMLIAADNNCQSCLMAPTEILANQHYNSIQSFLEGLDIKCALLTGSTKKSARTKMFEQLLTGEINILIGTHALIEDKVVFKALGLAVIDEQHRFGVQQRARLWAKSVIPPHVLVMTATPIPRTLAMTLYGDLDISIIDQLPPGRKPIVTVCYNDSQRLRLFGFMKKQIAEGRQIYLVFPLIKESETMDYKHLEDGYESIVRAFPPPQYVTAVVHGKMKPVDKEFSMNLFAKGKAHIMVATTVIEVGVNVPNASVMVIESAERFGLSQLHQLRGRVGRGADQSYCILMAGYKLGVDSKKRLDLMVSTNDGFKIAEEDLKLRGPGNLEGTQQSGVPLNIRLSNLATDGEIVSFARTVAQQILTEDMELALPQNALLVAQLAQNRNHEDFSKIS